MKIKHTKITASTNSSVTIPSPFDKYYELIEDDVVADLTGYYPEPGEKYPCEDVPGYDIQHLAWVAAKDEYEDRLVDDGLDIVELVSEKGGTPFLAYALGDRVYPVTKFDLEAMFEDDLDDIESSSNVQFNEFQPGDRVECYFGIYSGMKGTILEKVPNNQVENADPDRSYYEVEFDEPGYQDDYIIFSDQDLMKVLDAEDDLDACNDITGAIDTGLEYWYYTSHGLGPGMIPQGVNVVDTYEDEDGYKTWFKTDMLLTTEELNFYDIKEQWPPEGVITHNGELIESCTDSAQGKEDLFSSECKKVSEDSDTINYVISSEDIEGMSLVNYKNYKLFCDPNQGGWEVLTRDHDLVQSGFASEKDARNYIDRSLVDDITGAEDLEEPDDFDEIPEQEYSSADTAINGKQGKLPAVFSKATIPSGALVLDYGGGTVESEAVAQNYLDQFDATEMLYDPFNQTADHNREVIKTLRSNGGADVAVCSNVLNVIKEQNVRLDVLNKISKLLKRGANAYISVYEGSGKDNGAATQKGRSFQNNRKLSGYLEEVQSVFPEAVRKGAVIIAPNTGIAACTDIAGAIDIGSIDLDYLEKEIQEGVRDYFASPEGGWPEEELDQAVQDYSKVEVRDEGDHIVVEVRAELSYDGMMNLSEILDRIVEQYDEDAYFEQVTGGIMEAYIWGDGPEEDLSVNGNTDIKADYDFDRALAQHERYWLDPDYDIGRGKFYDYPEPEQRDPLEIDFDFDFVIYVQDNGYWGPEEGENPLYHAEDYTEDGLSNDQLEEDFLELLIWNIPADEGKYRVKGKVHMEYDYEDPEASYPWLNSRNCHVTDFTYTSAGKLDKNSESIESSTDIKAAMTEEELDNAILEGKPFDLDSFRKYKVPTNPNALKGKDIEVGDVIEVTEDASEVNLGTVVEVLAINDPPESWIDFTFRVKVVEDPGRQTIKVGDVIDIHFDADEEIGVIVPV